MADRRWDGSVEDVCRHHPYRRRDCPWLALRCRRPASRATMADEVLARFGRVDILVNNATTTAGSGMYDTISTEQYGRVFEVNVQGPLDLVQRFGPGMATRRQGWILNLTSKARRASGGTALLPPLHRWRP